MQLTFLTLAVGAGLAIAQDPAQGVPKCAQPCVTEWTTGNQIAGCKQLEIACVCKNQAFIEGVSCCLAQKCDKADQETAIKYAAQICGAEHVSVPDHLVCNSSAAPSGTAGSSAPASATGSSTTATGSSSGSGTTAAASNTGSATSTSASAASQTSSAGAAASTTGGAASGMISTGGVFGAILAMLAAL